MTHTATETERIMFGAMVLSTCIADVLVQLASFHGRQRGAWFDDLAHSFGDRIARMDGEGLTEEQQEEYRFAALHVVNFSIKAARERIEDPAWHENYRSYKFTSWPNEKEPQAGSQESDEALPSFTAMTATTCLVDALLALSRQHGAKAGPWLDNLEGYFYQRLEGASQVQGNAEGMIATAAQMIGDALSGVREILADSAWTQRSASYRLSARPGQMSAIREVASE